MFWKGYLKVKYVKWLCAGLPETLNFFQTGRKTEVPGICKLSRELFA